MVAIVVYVCAARLLLVATYPAQFAAHPWWVLGLAPSLPQAVGAAALAVAASLLYAAAWSVPWRSLLDSLTPACLLALAVAQLAPANHSGGLAACLLCACILACAPFRTPGATARTGLYVAGVSTLLFELLHSPQLVTALYNPRQAWAALAVVASFAIRTPKTLPAAPVARS